MSLTGNRKARFLNVPWFRLKELNLLVGDALAFDNFLMLVAFLVDMCAALGAVGEAPIDVTESTSRVLNATKDAPSVSTRSASGASVEEPIDVAESTSRVLNATEDDPIVSPAVPTSRGIDTGWPSKQVFA
jgi:hypothetical protein